MILETFKNFLVRGPVVPAPKALFFLDWTPPQVLLSGS